MEDQQQHAICQYNYLEFKVLIDQIDVQELNIKIINSNNLMKYELKNYKLNRIGVKTICLALQGKKNHGYASFDLIEKKTQQNQSLLLSITVESPFVQNLSEQIIFTSGVKISENQYFENKLNRIKKQLNELKNIYKHSGSYASTQIAQRQLKAGGYSTIGQIDKLKHGKYLFTVSLLMKVKTNGGVYIYLNQGQNIIQNNGMYTQTQKDFVPIVIKKIYVIDKNHPRFCLTTYSASTYPLDVKNVIVTAKYLEQCGNINQIQNNRKKKKNKKIK